MPEPCYSFHISSGVGSRSRRPMITMAVNGADFAVTLSPAEACDLAQNLLQAAAAAQNDAFFVGYLRELGLDETAILTALAELRKWKDRE